MHKLNVDMNTDKKQQEVLIYDDLKIKLTNLQRDLAKCRENIENYERQSKHLEHEELNIKQSFERTLSEESNKELNQYVNNLSAPVANKVTELEDELLELEDRFKEEMSKFSKEDLKDYYYSESEMLEDVHKALAMLNERLTNLIGERFQKELNQQLDSVSFKIQADDLEEICDYFEKLTEYFDNIQNNNSKVTSIENIVKKLNTIGNALETGNKQLTLVVMLVLCFIFYFAFKFVFPIYVIALAMFTIYNVKLSSKIYTTSLLRKVIEDNISAIEQMYRDKALAQLSLNNKLEIQDPSIVIVSFCNDTSKYFMHTQKMISAMLFKTDTNYSFDDRAFGFMYNAKQEDFIAMSFSDMYSSTVTIESLEESFQTLFCGKPMLTVDKIIEATPIDLLPLYDLNELLNSTYDYNELLLKPDAKPYGIFVWEKRLSKCFSQVCSLSTVMHIPLFICRQDGSLLIINWQNVFEDVKKYLEKMATKQP